jgi:hypothetical protein
MPFMCGRKRDRIIGFNIPGDKGVPTEDILTKCPKHRSCKTHEWFRQGFSPFIIAEFVEVEHPGHSNGMWIEICAVDGSNEVLLSLGKRVPATPGMVEDLFVSRKEYPS